MGLVAWKSSALLVTFLYHANFPIPIIPYKVAINVQSLTQLRRRSAQYQDELHCDCTDALKSNSCKTHMDIYRMSRLITLACSTSHMVVDVVIQRIRSARESLSGHNIIDDVQTRKK
ncbi:hypothetical protein SDJN02_21041, partial [Cucurbita argyrosperma subsp. argyrosperma]